jgi:hypothetical protein
MDWQTYDAAVTSTLQSGAGLAAYVLGGRTPNSDLRHWKQGR